MLLENKTVLIMGIRNKWSIAWGAARSAADNGAKVLFTFMGEENREKIEELISEIPNAKAYSCDASSDTSIKEAFERIKNENGKIDGILHSIAHANTEDLRNDFITTSREGFSHANDVSAYSFVAVARIADELEMLNTGASLVSLTYYGSTKVLPGYNIMGVAKAALETKTLSAKGIKDFGSILDVVEEKAPLKRNVTTEEVGDVVSFLFSKMSSSITGQVIYADNGYNIMGI